MKRVTAAIAVVFALSIGGAFAQSGNVNTNATSGTYGVFIETLGTTYPDVAVKAHDSIRFFNSSSLELLRVTTTGKVQVGIPPATDDTLRLHVYENVNRGSVVQIENGNIGDTAAAAFRARTDSAAVNLQAHSSIRNLTRYGQSMAGWTELMNWTGNGLALATTHNAPLIIGTNSAERLRVLGDGKIGIGTTTPTERLHVFEDADANSIVTVENPNTGTMAVAVLRAKSNGATVNFEAHGSGRTISRFGVTLANWAEFLGVAGNGLIVGTNGATPLILGTSATDRIHILANGNVGIGTTNPAFLLDVNGNAHFSGTVSGGNIQAQYQDVAEWVPASTAMAPGTVVVLNPEKSNEVMPSWTEYDTSVAGVVSAQPGVLLGVASPSKAQIATTGRVKVHVDASAAPIGIGDLLVTSGKPGVAMKSQPMDINGRKFHQPGTVIGKALEPLKSGEGEILVLLSLQ